PFAVRRDGLDVANGRGHDERSKLKPAALRDLAGQIAAHVVAAGEAVNDFVNRPDVLWRGFVRAVEKRIHNQTMQQTHSQPLPVGTMLARDFGHLCSASGCDAGDGPSLVLSGVEGESSLIPSRLDFL